MIADLPFWTFVLLGFGAQIIDGGVGMGFGIITNTVLISLGISPVVSSGSVHSAGIFTSGMSGLSHWFLGNVDRKLFLRLLIPGVVGALAGSLFIKWLPVNIIKPLVSFYLLSMGIIILYRTIRNGRVAFKESPFRWVVGGLYRLWTRYKSQDSDDLKPRFIQNLASTGGFLDAVGGGGWGPIVTSSLLLKEQPPRMTIGSVNAAESLIALTTAATLFAEFPDLHHLKIIGGLLVGGIIAAPFAALTSKYLPARLLLFLVGILMTLLTLFSLSQGFF